ncbi:MAG TPA: Rieske (2Fe-2S) protein [Dehalococcoidia bacterium]|nr:Rieske (2Fe-2S) protein [Dehalococcoidia bacterium]
MAARSRAAPERLVLLVAAATFLLLAAAVGVAFLWPASAGPLTAGRTGQALSGEITAGRVNDIPLREPVQITQGRLWLVRLDGERFIALSWRDPHQGCTVPWRPEFEFLGTRGWFRNPCHGQTYDLEGYCRFGTCERGLDRFAVRTVQGKVLIDTRRVIPGPERRPEHCLDAYPTVCLPPQPTSFRCQPLYAGMVVLPPDPLGLDPDGDGLGCEP